MNPKVSIVIVNWNGYKDTRELLESLKILTYPNFEIYVVDNNSSGDDVMELQKYGEYIYLITSGTNSGFAGGSNMGIRLALKNNTDFILLLNNDTIVEQNFLEPLVQTALISNNIGITSPKINYYSNPTIIWSSGGSINFFRGSGFAQSNIDEQKTDIRTREVTFVSGCCMLIKKEVFEKTGLLDEKFFLYLEDTDFCFRTLRKGYKIMVVPASRIYHKVKSSSNSIYSTLYYETRNRLFFVRKHHPLILPLTFVYIFLTILIKSLYWFLTSKRDNIFAVKKSFFDFMRGKTGPLDQSEKVISR